MFIILINSQLFGAEILNDLEMEESVELSARVSEKYFFNPITGEEQPISNDYTCTQDTSGNYNIELCHSKKCNASYVDNKCGRYHKNEQGTKVYGSGSCCMSNLRYFLETIF